MPQLMSDAILSKDLDRYENKLYGLECMQCGSCSYICPAKRPLTQMFKQAKGEIMARKRAEAGGKK
jgi:electron transport complex protein RnfC